MTAGLILYITLEHSGRARVPPPSSYHHNLGKSMHSVTLSHYSGPRLLSPTQFFWIRPCSRYFAIKTAASSHHFKLYNFNFVCTPEFITSLQQNFSKQRRFLKKIKQTFLSSIFIIIFVIIILLPLYTFCYYCYYTQSEYSKSQTGNA